MQRQFVATHVIAVPITLHSSNQTVLSHTEFVDHKAQTNVRFESLTLVLTM